MQKTITSRKYQNLISWLIEARTSQGITVRELANRLETVHSAVQRIEQLERRLDVNEFILYCNALNVDPRDGLELLL